MAQCKKCDIKLDKNNKDGLCAYHHMEECQISPINCSRCSNICEKLLTWLNLMEKKQK